MTPWALTRRAFLERSLVASAALALPSVVLGGCRGRYEDEVPAGLRLRALAPWEFVTLRAAAGRILAGAGDGPGAEEVARRADAELAEIDALARAGVRQALLVVEYGTALRGHVRPFSALPPERQDRVLDGLARSRLQSARVAFAAVKLLACFYHYSDPGTWPALGYDGPWVGRIALPAHRVDYGSRNGEPFVSERRPFPAGRG
jgi:hypothetical protein